MKLFDLGGRVAAVEVLINSRHIGELIEKGDLNEIKDAMENSMVPGSQTFEQALYELYKNNTITLEDALASADSANNLQQVINNAAAAAAPVESSSETPAAAGLSPTKSVAPGSFSEFTLNLDN
jgi:twitching motility protein PilU